LKKWILIYSKMLEQVFYLMAESDHEATEMVANLAVLAALITLYKYI